VYIDPDELFVFGADANLVARPKVQEVAYGAY
jgi:glycerol transport system ATP-binding protein